MFMISFLTLGLIYSKIIHVQVFDKQNTQLLAKSLDTHSYFTQLLYHQSFSVLLKILKSYIFSMHIASFKNNFIFYNSDFKCIEQGFIRIERTTFSTYYLVNLEKYKIVFKLLASNCTLYYYVMSY